jgi:putative holliday junction resolvase
VSEQGARGRVLGLDLGDARIGVAISDPARRLAVPLGTVQTGAPHDVKAIAAMVREHGVTEVVVGHPRSMSGQAGPQARHAERFADALGTALELPVHAGAGPPPRAVDRSAATVILQAWLDARLGPGG